MEKLANTMGQMSTKDDLTNAVGPLTKSVTKLEEQFQHLSTSFTTFEQKIKNDIENMESRISAVEVALATGTLSEDAKQKFEGI